MNINWEIRNIAAQFDFGEYIIRIFFAVQLIVIMLIMQGFRFLLTSRTLADVKDDIGPKSQFASQLFKK